MCSLPIEHVRHSAQVVCLKKGLLMINSFRILCVIFRIISSTIYIVSRGLRMCSLPIEHVRHSAQVVA
jgi:hypothetical protein